VYSYGDGCVEAGEIFFLVAGSGVGHKVGGGGGRWQLDDITVCPCFHCTLEMIAPLCLVSGRGRVVAAVEIVVINGHGTHRVEGTAYCTQQTKEGAFGMLPT